MMFDNIFQRRTEVKHQGPLEAIQSLPHKFKQENQNNLSCIFFIIS